MHQLRSIGLGMKLWWSFRILCGPCKHAHAMPAVAYGRNRRDGNDTAFAGRASVIDFTDDQGAHLVTDSSASTNVHSAL